MEDETNKKMIIDPWMRTTDKRIEDARTNKEKGTKLFKVSNSASVKGEKNSQM